MQRAPAPLRQRSYGKKSAPAPTSCTEKTFYELFLVTEV